MNNHTTPVVEVDRTLATREIPAGEARSAIFRRIYDAPVEDVWDACTDPERLRRWFGPVSGDFREGGHYVVAMAKGQILRCEPPRVLTLEWAGDDPENPSEQVELRLQPAAEGGTVFELEHSTIGGEFEWKGKLIDLITLLGGGWEPAFVSLDVFLHGETPADFDLEAFRKRPEIAAVANRAEEAWSELVGLS